MKTAWTKGLDADQSKEIRSLFNGATLLRRRLTDMLVDKSTSKEKAMMNATEYDTSNWAYKQADANGYKRAMAEIVSLLK